MLSAGGGELMRGPRRAAARPGMVLALACLALTLLLPAAAQARWSPPFDFSPPGTLDIASPQLALSPSGAAAAAFNTFDVDTPGRAQAYVSVRSGQGTVGTPVAITGAAQILDAVYDHGSLQLLTGTAASGQTCCAGAAAVTVGADGTQTAPRTLVGGLTGTTLGRLVPLADGHTVAAVATERGVWVIQSRGHGQWGPQHLLTLGGKMPESLATARLGANGSALAWTAPKGLAGTVSPRTIFVATGARGAAPRRVRTAVTVPAGHRVDELGIAARGSAVTLAWVETWFDRSGYHAVIRATDLVPHATTRTLSPAGPTASGLRFSGDPAGDQTIVWQSCAAVDACAIRSASRTAHGTFGASRTLGPADPDQSPALAVSPSGQAISAWTLGGHPMAAVRRGAGGRFGGAARLSPTLYAFDMTVAFGANGQALAAWSQGTLNPGVVGAADVF